MDKVHLERDRLQKDVQTFSLNSRTQWSSPETFFHDKYCSADEQQKMEQRLQQEVERVKCRSRARAAIEQADDEESIADSES